MLRSVSFPCHIVSSEDIEVDPKKIEVVKNWPRPLTPTYIQIFFGLAGYYMRFIDGFASISSPLITLTQKNVKFEWLEACERAFQGFKEKIAFAPIVTVSEGTKGFVVYCDSSRVGLSCLLRKHGKVIAYTSRQLKVHEILSI